MLLAPGPVRARLSGLPRGGLVVLAIAAVWLGYWWPVLSGDALLYQRDLMFYWLPSKWYWVERIGALELPWWSARVAGGSPFLADISNQTFYPLNLLFLLVDDLGYALSLFVIAHLLLASLGFALLARRLGAGHVPALFGALIYGYSGAVISYTDNLTYLPAAAWAAVGLAVCAGAGGRYGHRRATGLLALTLSMLILVGDGLSVVALLLLGSAILPTGQSALRARVLSRCRFAAVATGLALAVSAIQLLPTLELLAQSGRGAGLDAGEVLRWSFPPPRLIELVQPMFFGARYPVYEYLGANLYPGTGDPWLESVYLGVIPLALALYAMIAAPRHAWLWGSVAATALVLSFGRHLPGLGAMIESSGLLRVQRYPEKLVFWGSLCLCVLACRGYTLLWHSPDRGRARLATLRARLLASLATVVALHWLLLDLPARAWIWEGARSASDFWSWRLGGQVSQLQGLAWHAWLVSLPLLAWIWWPQARRRSAMLLLGAAAAADLLWVHVDQTPVVDAGLFPGARAPVAVSRLAEIGLGADDRIYRDSGDVVLLPGPRAVFEARLRELDRERGPRRAQSALWSFAAQSLWDQAYPNSALPYGGSYFNGEFSPLVTVRHARAQALLDRDPSPQTLRRLGIRFVVTSLVPPRERWHGFDGLERVRDPGHNLRILALDDPLPRLRGRAPITVDGHRGTEERHRFTVRNPVGQPLVFTETYYPGWTAAVDGAPAPVTSTGAGFISVPTPAGSHSVAFRYASTYAGMGALATLAGLIVCAWLVLAHRPTGPGK